MKARKGLSKENDGARNVIGVLDSLLEVLEDMVFRGAAKPPLVVNLAVSLMGGAMGLPRLARALAELNEAPELLGDPESLVRLLPLAVNVVEK